MARITLDIETIGDFLRNGDLSGQELTIVCTHNSDSDTYDSFLKEELPRLWPMLEKAESIIGYNSDHFDIPILNRYYAGDLTKIKSVDLMKEVQNVVGRRLKLDNIAEATLGKKKSGHGLEAVEWWKNGEVEKVRAYCIEDVRLTKDLYEYAKKNGSLKYRDFDGVREVKLDTSNWEKFENAPGLTHTLPF